jgi:hypothetical protein
LVPALSLVITASNHSERGGFDAKQGGG